MIDNKWLRYQASILSKREGITFDEAYKRVQNDPVLGKAEEFVTCPVCDVELKGKNIQSHMQKHSVWPKINWNRIPIIREQRKEKKRLKKIAGKPDMKVMSGGLPSLGKRSK